MKHTFILLTTLIILTPLISLAQRTAEFEYVFHFEDAIGNKDSVTIGYDPDASYDFPNGCFDPEFGEVKLESPFDSIFEVRVSHDAFNVRVPGPCNYFLKKAISKAVGPSTQPGCYTGGKYIFWMTNAHPPVTISWNQNDFLGNKCYTNSYIAIDYQDEWIDYWWQDSFSMYYCLAEVNSADIWIDPIYHHKKSQFTFETVFDIEGNGMDTIYGFAVSILPSHPFGPCGHILPNSNEDVNTTSDIRIYPNPVLDVLKIGVDDEIISAFTISSIEGVVVKKANIITDEIDVSNLNPGIYVLKAHINDDYWIVNKFCKM